MKTVSRGQRATAAPDSSGLGDLRWLLEATPDLVALWNGERLLFLNRAGRSFLGLDPLDETERIPPGDLAARLSPNTLARLRRELQSGRPFRGEILLERHDGAKVAFSAVVYEHADEGPASERLFAATCRDLSAQKAYELELKSSLYADDLTGLSNRRRFLELLQQRLSSTGDAEDELGLIAIDIDRFKALNDSLGPAAGDRLLIAMADRIQMAVRASDLVARLSGDEFVVLCTRVDPNTLEDIAVRIRDALALPFTIAHRKLTITASLGIVDRVELHHEAETVLQDAIAAVSIAKERGGDQNAIYDPVRRLEVASRLDMEQELRRALRDREFELRFQKEVWISSGDLVCLEALLRWRHRNRDIVSPEDFIPIAESTGLIVPIGDWVLAEVCDQIVEWERIGLHGMSVSVNISPRQLEDADFPARVQQILSSRGVTPNQINLEITESMLARNERTLLQRVRELRDAGFTMIMDDFGTGYSSLSQLRSLPFGVLKIDKAFVLDIVDSASDRQLVDAMIRMAHALGRIVVAEGVETLEHVELLTRSSCDIAQGWHYGRPVSGAEITAELAPDAKGRAGDDGGAAG